MTSTSLPVVPANNFAASDTFMYTCHRCRRCCQNKRIRVNPYEVYRLARNRGLSTTDFLAAHTICGGTELARRDDGTCVFLTEEGCGVHTDRPLVCRLYPLGRRVLSGEPDTYFMTETHPESEGVFSEDGTVGAFLESQGAGPFAAAADRYYDFLLRLSDVISRRGTGDTREYDAAAEVLGAAPELQQWLDIDAVIASAGDDPSVTASSPETAMARHISLLEQRFVSAVPGSPHLSEEQPA